MIKPLDQLTLLQRALLAAATVVVVLILLGLVSCFSQPSESAEPLKLFPPHPPGVCGDEYLQNDIRNIMRGGLDDALHGRAQQLLEVWLKDQTGQPQRAANGLFQSINAYVIARASIDNWELPRCK